MGCVGSNNIYPSFVLALLTVVFKGLLIRSREGLAKMVGSRKQLIPHNFARKTVPPRSFFSSRFQLNQREIGIPIGRTTDATSASPALPPLIGTGLRSMTLDTGWKKTLMAPVEFPGIWHIPTAEIFGGAVYTLVTYVGLPFQPWV